MSALHSRKIIITCGTGGVGKTTLSAAIALKAALAGKRALVITIDPAKRLANALGLDHLGDDPVDLTPILKTRLPSSISVKGTLHAVMPDTRRTFEGFIQSVSPNAAAAERIMRNPIFEVFAKEFSGSNEYMALQRLYDAAQVELDASQRDFDLIVLDTPPSRNTLAFLDAPTVLSGLFDEKIVQWIAVPANKIVNEGLKRALGILEGLTGKGFITHLLAFGASLFEIRVGFAAKLKRITALLKSDSVGFLIIAGASSDRVPEMNAFVERVKRDGLHLDGVIVNRMLSPIPASHTARDPALEAVYSAVDKIRKDETLAIETMRKQGLNLIAQLPELTRDIHGLEDLHYVASHLPIE